VTESSASSSHYFVGIDIGSTMTKAVILEARVIASVIGPSMMIVCLDSKESGICFQSPDRMILSESQFCHRK